MHLAQGIGKRNIVNAMTSCGFTFVLWVADWFALMNLKLGGDLNKIQTVGRYFIEVWKAAGMDTSRVRCVALFLAQGLQYCVSLKK